MTDLATYSSVFVIGMGFLASRRNDTLLRVKGRKERRRASPASFPFSTILNKVVIPTRSEESQPHLYTNILTNWHISTFSHFQIFKLIL